MNEQQPLTFRQRRTLAQRTWRQKVAREKAGRPPEPTIEDVLRARLEQLEAGKQP
jgi:hypothetical protein